VLTFTVAFAAGVNGTDALFYHILFDDGSQHHSIAFPFPSRFNDHGLQDKAQTRTSSYNIGSP